jgi:hypothetical protein
MRAFSLFRLFVGIVFTQLALQRSLILVREWCFHTILIRRSRSVPGAPEAIAASVAHRPSADWYPAQDEQGNTYYVNRVTGETAWEKPSSDGYGAQG